MRVYMYKYKQAKEYTIKISSYFFKKKPYLLIKIIKVHEKQT
jgi:hypothetical protein